ncbi:Inorganic phosphate transporter PHO86 [Spathaspora sp. JA1]|nr:Inorganic phosphate transporter PHO86 [Spathaspora sp. JA1]
MAVQKEVDLNQPLDAHEAATLAKTPLKPEFARAALILHGDTYKQSQAKLNRYIFWHPIAVIAYFLLIPAALLYNLWGFIEVSDSALEFVMFAKKNPKDFFFGVISAFPMIAGLFATFGLITFIMGDDIGGITSSFVAQKYCDKVFGFDIKKFASLTGHETDAESVKLLKQGLNTEIIMYRESPIAICTLVVDEQQSTPEGFIVEITGLHVRKVFENVDFYELLIEWAVLRSRELYFEYAKQKKIKSSEGNTILITTEAYSFDKRLQDCLYTTNFGVMSKDLELNKFGETLNKPKEILHKILRVSRDTFGLALSTAKEDEEIVHNLEGKFLAKEEEVIDKPEPVPAGVRKRRG